LILDPFVRLHRVDENVSAAVVPLLAFLRELQRRYRLAIAVVHHARKGASHLRPGQALRGSSEFHAWADSSLHLRRKGDAILLSAEHRAHPSPPDLALTLHARPSSLALLADDLPAPAGPAADPFTPCDRERILAALRSCDEPPPPAGFESFCGCAPKPSAACSKTSRCAAWWREPPQGGAPRRAPGAPAAPPDPSPAQLPFPFPDPPMATQGNGNGKPGPPP